MEKNRRVDEIAEDLFDAADLFIETFERGGELKTRFDGVRNCLVELNDIDPQYQSQMGLSEPYGVEIKSETLKFIITQYLGGRWYHDSSLEDVVVRLFEQSYIPECPTNRD